MSGEVRDLDEFEYTLTRRALRHIKAEVLIEAAAELQRLDRIGKTPIREVLPADSEWYQAHPLQDLVSYGGSHRLMVANWLEARAEAMTSRDADHNPREEADKGARAGERGAGA